MIDNRHCRAFVRASGATVRGVRSHGARRRAAFIALATAGICSTILTAPATAGQDWAPKVQATYKLHMLGMEIATFNFNSTVVGEKYQSGGYTKMSLGLGMYKYTGSFSGTGTIAGETVTPSSYVYEWKFNGKSGGVHIGFGSDGVEKVVITPPHSPAPDVVPLLSWHLRAVFDPLSALMVLSRHHVGNPCERKVGVFEGKQRFDVILTPHRQEKITEKKPSGQPTTGNVCKARYVPVAGHRLNRETQALIKADGIEIAFRLVPEANLAIPYRITMPTPLGIAILTAQKVDISAPGNGQIALSH
jgi:hypothetical protein